MGNTAKWSAAAALAVIAGAAHAGDRGDFRITPYLGRGSLRVDGRHLQSGQSQTYQNWVTGISVGYRAPFGLVVELGTSATGEPLVGWATGGELREDYLAAGYDLVFGNAWHFTPRLGVTRWSLESGVLGDLLDDSGQERQSLDGDDAYVELALTKELNRHVALGASFRQADASFGSTRALAFTAVFSF